MAIAEAQLINKLLDTKDYNIILDNGVNDKDFSICKDEFAFVKSFYQKYACIPDKETFINKFPDFDIFKVDQPVRAIIDELFENSLFRRAVSVINTASTLFEADANKGAEYILSHINELQPTYTFNSTDIAHDTSRYDEWEDKIKNLDQYFMPSGFKELDEAGLIGLNRKEEFMLIMARTGVGKTMVSIKMAENAWSLGFNVFYFSPEMSTNAIGYRFDSAYNHFSNKELMFGGMVANYKEYMNNLVNSKAKFNVSTMKDFNDVVTVPKLREACRNNKSDVLFIDGFDYITDVRATRTSSREDRLGHVAQDLLNLSLDLSIPVVAVIQANRKSVDNDCEMGTQHITGADKIGASCTRLITLTATGPALQFAIPKNRYATSGTKVLYSWDIDHSQFYYIPNLEDVNKDKDSKQDMEEAKDSFTNVF